MGKKIYLTQQQAQMHGDSVVPTDDPVGDEAAVEFDLSEWEQALNGNGPPPTPTTISIVNLDLAAETWTDFANSSMVTSFTVMNSEGNNLTDSFDYRRSDGGKWQIFSLISVNNLEIVLYG